tara:strand:- start:3067 stop:3249 length:183 start_codon:yes stop_codon:yes gene_type:complete
MKGKIAAIITLSSVVALLLHHQSRYKQTQLTYLQLDVLTQAEIPLLPLKLGEDGLELSPK